jgi:hypothetical protein
MSRKNDCCEYGFNSIRLMTPEMIEAHKYYQNTKNQPCLPGKTISMYLPKHGDLGCYCNACTLYKLSRGEQDVITINLPAIKHSINISKDTNSDKERDQSVNDSNNSKPNEEIEQEK